MQQAGVTHLIASTYFMFQRFRKKLQVGKYEKFGYGVFVSQLSATALGMRALFQTGFVDTFVSGLFAALERDNELRPREERRVIGPSVTKAATYLIKALATYEGLGYLIQEGGTGAARAKGQPPTDIHSLIRQLVLLESPDIVALHNAETFHLTGLRIIMPLLMCLDSRIAIETQFGVTERLLELQEGSRHPVTNDLIIDAPVLLRNQALVASLLVGGSSERRLPTVNLDECKLPLPFPLFSSHPLPDAYWVGDIRADGADRRVAKDHLKSGLQELEGLLISKVDGDSPEIFHSVLQKVLRLIAHLPKSDRMDMNPQLTAFMLKLVTGFVASRDKTSRPTLRIVLGKGGGQLDQHDALGAEIASDYGARLGILVGMNTDAFGALVVGVKAALSEHIHEDDCSGAKWRGFDWFTATIYLMNQGSLEGASSLLSSAFAMSRGCRDEAGLSAGALDFLWYTSVAGSKRLSRESAHPVYFKMTHMIEHIVSARLPAVWNAFRLSGLTIAQVCTTWIRQCFWNVLDWADIVQYITISMIHGPRMQAFFCIALLKHLEPVIVERTQAERLAEHLLTSPVFEFCAADSMPFMQMLDAEWPVEDDAFSF